MIVWTRRNSDDGKQIFAVGAQRRGELVRYDAKTHDFLPYLGGISAADPTYSRDGKWMVYMSYPEQHPVAEPLGWQRSSPAYLFPRGGSLPAHFTRWHEGCL